MNINKRLKNSEGLKNDGIGGYVVNLNSLQTVLLASDWLNAALHPSNSK